MGVFSAILPDSPDLNEPAASGVFEIAELDFVTKIEFKPISGALGPIFTQNLSLPREQLAARARRPRHRVSRQILLKERALLPKF